MPPTYFPDDVFPGRAEVRFIGLDKRCFDKIQSRRGGEAKQRVENGLIEMEAVCQGNILLEVNVSVFREPEAAALHGDKNGRVALPVRMGTHEIDKVCGVRHLIVRLKFYLSADPCFILVGFFHFNLISRDDK